MAGNFPDLPPIHRLQSFLVGLASDFWIGSLISAIVLLIAIIVPRQWLKWPAFTAMALLGILISAHQGYVEFYRSSVMAFHLHYLLDLDFLRASLPSGFSNLVLLNLGAAVLAAYLITRPPKVQSSVNNATLRNGAMAVVLTVIMAGVVHAGQIRYRVQWFVPGPMQFNALEKIYVDLTHGNRIAKLNKTENRIFTHWLEEAIAEQQSLTTLPAKLKIRLKQNFHEAIELGQKPLLIVMALESFRPSEIGIYRKPTPIDATRVESSLTPTFDSLAQNGILFRSAWSTGTITASGQEALWCGTPSGLFTSLMRVQTHIHVNCIPDVVENSDGTSLWLHNGEARFDNQVSFWRRHRVNHLISAIDFPGTTPGGSWGYSDLALARRSAREITDTWKAADKKFLTPFILTVSNHIPWDLPDDAPSHIKAITAPDGQNQRMWRTTAYTDHAIGIFVEEMKREGLWDQMLLILVSDHGNLEPGKHLTALKDSPARRQSHISLLLTGGLIGKSLRQETRKDSIQVNQPVGQAGVATLLHDLIGTTSAAIPSKKFTLAPDILTWPEWWPVISDQNDHLFIPGLTVDQDLILKKSELQNTSDKSFDESVRDLRRPRTLNPGLIYRGSIVHP